MKSELPPRGVQAMAVVRWVILLCVGALAIGSWVGYARSESDASSPAKRTRWHCPMHPQIISDQPGECPICHMTLEPFEETAGPSDAGSDTPPESQVRVSPAKDAGAIGSLPKGTVPLQLSFDRIQSIGVRTSVVAVRDTKSTIRVTATVEASERGASEVHVRTPGFVERVFVHQIGDAVRAGQPLFTFYAPTIFEAEKELLASSRWSDAGDPIARAAGSKLELLGMQSSEIDVVRRSAEAHRAISVSAPSAGYVMKKSIVQGSYVTPEMNLYSIVDLSRVYVIASVLPLDRHAISLGAEATFRPSRSPERTRGGSIDLVYPEVDRDTRTTRARVELANDDHSLLPGDWGTLEIVTGQRRVPMVPRDALVDTGIERYVFVDEGNGRFVPRIVEVGEEGDGEIAISGVAEGERVVSGATFLVDSESRLRASMTRARP